jgi:hypothetical protein
MSSHAIHGSWTDLKTYHLEHGTDPAMLEAEFHEPRIEAVAMPSSLSLSAAAAFLELVVGKQAEEVMRRLEKLAQWYPDLTRKYEEWYVARRRGDEREGEDTRGSEAT